MNNRSIVRAVIGGQLLVTAACGAAWGVASGKEAGLAAATGGLIAVLPALYLAFKVLSVAADADPKQIVRAFYIGEVVKFGLTVALFVLALQFFAAAFGPLIMTYILAILMYWTVLRSSSVIKQR